MVSERKLQRTGQAGFSLLEIIVAIAILTILMGTAIPLVSVSMERTKKTETKKELNTLQTGIEAYFHDVWALPPNLGELLENGTGASGWVGPYVNPPLSASSSTLPDIDKDAWNNDYILTVQGTSAMEIRSKGPDDTANTADDIVTTVDVTHIRRASTLEEVSILNAVITAYNKVWLEDAPLTPQWNTILQKLRSKGFLPVGDTEIESDGWGNAYEADPPGATPVVKVTSLNL